MNHPDIDKAERYGMPEGKPETETCVVCDKTRTKDVMFKCESCGANVCQWDKTRILDNDYCSLECADEDIRNDFLKLQSERDRLKDENKRMRDDFAVTAVQIDQLWQIRQDSLCLCKQRSSDEPFNFGAIKGRAEWWSK